VNPSDADRQILQVPSDAVQLRHQDPRLALAWRFALREVLVAAFATGLEVVAVSRDGHYLLERASA
jgi:predicted GNAT superfamily acetyltransferase